MQTQKPKPRLVTESSEPRRPESARPPQKKKRRPASPVVIRQLSRKQKWIKGLKVAGIVLGGSVLCGGVALGMCVWNWLQDCPELDTTLLNEISQSSIIYDKDGKQVTTYSGYENREWVPLEDIPQAIKDGIVYTEDKRFFSHDGIDFKRLLGALAGQLTRGADYGGSTLTQQLVKNVYLTSEVSYKRKVQEIALSLQLEKEMTKEEILEAYLNVIYLGGANYGVKAAARDFFGKELDELSIMECALIAGLTQNPNGYNPRMNQEKGDMEPTVKRTETVLYCMHENERISDAEYRQAEEDLKNIQVAKETSHPDIYPYPHYVEYVLDEVAEDLLKAEGKPVTAEDLAYKKYAIRNGGYRIYTSLDQNAQKVLQEEAAKFKDYPEGKDGSKAQVSAVLIDQSTGGVAAMIGSREVPKAQETYNRATTSQQPIGSTMKPIAIYAAALENGAGTGTPVADYPCRVSGYDNGRSYPGGVTTNAPMTLRRAVETSNNIPAAHFLCDYVGIETSANYLVQLGVSGSHISHTGSGLALGTSDVTTLEIAGAYAALANQGTFIEPHAYTSVVNSHSEEVLSSKVSKAKRQVYSEQTAWMITDVMKGNVEHGGGTAARFDKKRETAGKSGTHEDNVITFGGYTADCTLFIRMGCDSFSPMKGFVGGGTQTAALWNRCMARIHEKKEYRPLQQADPASLGIVKVKVCNVSGQIATDACRERNCQVEEYFRSGSEPKDKCGMHIEICTETKRRANDSCRAEGCAKVVTAVPASSYLSSMPKDMLSQSLPGYSSSAQADMECGLNHTSQRLEKEAEEAREREEEERRRREEEEEKEKEREEERRRQEEERQRQQQNQQNTAAAQNAATENAATANSPDGQEGVLPADQQTPPAAGHTGETPGSEDPDDD